MKKLQEMINKASNPELSEQIGMVSMIWDDGEITMQKSGDLLWQRTLHCRKPAIKVIEDIEWPDHHGKHGFAFVSRENAEEIREEIKRLVILQISAS